METFNNFLGGTAALFGDPLGIAIFFGGVIGGMLFGAIPGVSMLTLAAILLPFTAHLSAEHGIMLFSVIYCTGVYGGAITAILFNIPGAPENAPTAFDGYPMTLQGKAGKAVGAAVMCSAIGGVVSCIIMMIATAPIADWAISAFGPPEIFALVFFGLAVAASVGAKTFWKGWLSIMIGLMIAVVGLDPVGGIERYNFNMPYLAAGFSAASCPVSVRLWQHLWATTKQRDGQRIEWNLARVSLRVSFPVKPQTMPQLVPQ